MKKLAFLWLGLALATAPARALAACGDAVIDVSEGCDDGNGVDGDGCSASCAVEAGYSCRTFPALTIVNPSFETLVADPGFGWTVREGTVDQVNTATGSNCLPAGDGTFSIDMNGSSRGQLTQDLTTVPGTRYVVVFLGNANCVEFDGQPCNTSCSKRLTVSVSDVSDPNNTAFARSVYQLPGTPQVNPWRLTRFEFVAQSTNTRLTFTGSDPSFAGPMIDRVLVPPSVCDRLTCGDGVLDGFETCDDGNVTGGDGCSSTCIREVGYSCDTAGSPCTGTCGDGILTVGEACDDRNTTDGDGCSATCTVESGYVCTFSPFNNYSTCNSTCGNGTVDSGEACDDGNSNQLDACSNACLKGPGETCTAAAQCNLNSCSTTCGGCYDTAAAGMTDFGCSASAPACDDSDPMAPVCRRCRVDADCGSGGTCTTSFTCTFPDAGVDAGTDAGTDAGMDGGVDLGVDLGMDTGVDLGTGSSDTGVDLGSGSDTGVDLGAATDSGPTRGGAAGGALSCAAVPPEGERSALLTWLAGAALVARFGRRRRV